LFAQCLAAGRQRSITGISIVSRVEHSAHWSRKHRAAPLSQKPSGGDVALSWPIIHKADGHVDGQNAEIRRVVKQLSCGLEHMSRELAVRTALDAEPSGPTSIHAPNSFSQQAPRVFARTN
jgi:hypothetical protein